MKIPNTSLSLPVIHFLRRHILKLQIIHHIKLNLHLFLNGKHHLVVHHFHRIMVMISMTVVMVFIITTQKGSLSSSGHLENPSKNRQSRMMNGIKLPNFPLLNNPSSSLNEGASLPNVSMSKTTISAKASAAQDDYVMKGGIDALSKAVEAMYINERGEKFDRARLGLVGQKLSEKRRALFLT